MILFVDEMQNWMWKANPENASAAHRLFALDENTPLLFPVVVSSYAYMNSLLVRGGNPPDEFAALENRAEDVIAYSLTVTREAAEAIDLIFPRVL